MVDYRAEKGQVTRTKNLETCKTADRGFTTHSQVSEPLHPHTHTQHTGLLLNDSCVTSASGPGCEQEVQVCYSVHTGGWFHPLGRG